MKAKQILLVLVLTVILCSCGAKGSKNEGTADSTVQSSADASGEPVTVKKYGIKSGIVTFEMDMMGMKEKMVLYFEDYGAKEAEEEYRGENVKSISLCDGKEMYNIIPAQKTAFTSGSCYRGIAYRFAWDEISKEDQNTKAKKLSNMTVADKDCESFSYDMGNSSTVYAGWNNICLYQKTATKSGTITKTAIKIEEDAAIPADKLQVPSGFEKKKSGFQ